MTLTKTIINDLYNKKKYIICIFFIILLFIIIYLWSSNNNEMFTNQNKSPAIYYSTPPYEPTNPWEIPTDTWTVPTGVTQATFTVVGGKGAGRNPGFGANVTLPGGNVDGTTYSISSNVATTLAVYGQDGVSVSPGANVQLTAGTSVSYLYYATDTKWYKIS